MKHPRGRTRCKPLQERKTATEFHQITSTRGSDHQHHTHQLPSAALSPRYPPHQIPDVPLQTADARLARPQLRLQRRHLGTNQRAANAVTTQRAQHCTRNVQGVATTQPWYAAMVHDKRTRVEEPPRTGQQEAAPAEHDECACEEGRDAAGGGGTTACSSSVPHL